MSKEERRMTQEEKAAAQDQKYKARGGHWKQRWSQKVNYKNYRYSHAWEGCWY